MFASVLQYVRCVAGKKQIFLDTLLSSSAIVSEKVRFALNFFSGYWKAESLQSTLHHLVAHHDVLRSRFTKNESGWVQFIFLQDEYQTSNRN